MAMRDKQTYTPRLRWGVWCVLTSNSTVESGWKRHHGKRLRFNTQEEAQAEAARVQAIMDQPRLSRSRFHYSARPI